MDRLYYQTIVIPANTPLATPSSVTWPLEDNHLNYVDIIVPPGNAGNVGFRILWANQQIIPWANNSFIVTDNEKLHIDCDVDITLTGLVIQAYNTDIFAHTLYFRALISDTPVNTAGTVTETTSTLALPNELAAQGVSGINTLTAPDTALEAVPTSADLSLGADEVPLGEIISPVPVVSLPPSGLIGSPIVHKITPKPITRKVPPRRIRISPIEKHVASPGMVRGKIRTHVRDSRVS